MTRPSSPGLTIASGRKGEDTKEKGPILLILKNAKDGVGVLVGIGVRDGLNVRVGIGVRDGILVRVGVRVIVGVKVIVADKSGVNVKVGSDVFEDVIVSGGMVVTMIESLVIICGVAEDVFEGVGDSKMGMIVSEKIVVGSGFCPLQAEITMTKNTVKIIKKNRLVALKS
jgi:hypothetical protein